MDRARTTVATGWGHRLSGYIPRLLGAIPVLMIPALEWMPSIPDRLRPWIILIALALAAVGFIWMGSRERRMDELVAENSSLKRGIGQAEPEYLLQNVAGTIFRQGAWRLTVYRKAYSPDPALGDHLVKVASVASDRDQRELTANRVRIQSSTLFQHLFLSNLADSRFRRAEQSGAFSGDVQSDEWFDWRNGIFGASSREADDRSIFKARKYVWYAAQEPRSQAVFATVAESADPEGIVVEYLDHVLTPAWLFFVGQLAEMKGAVDHSPPDKVSGGVRRGESRPDD